MLRSAVLAVVVVALPALAHAQDAGVPLGRGGIESPDALAAFRGAMATAAHTPRGQPRVGVVVLGDSHTAAGIWTETLRSALAARVGDAGQGLVFPVRPFPAYRAGDLDVSSSGEWIAHRVTARDRTPDAYGLAGIYVESVDPLATGALRTPDGTPAQRAELWLWAQPGGGHLLVGIDEGTPVRIDLATHGTMDAPHTVYVPLALPAGTHVLHVAPEGDGPVRILGCALEHADARGVAVDALGINGARAKDQLSWDDALFAEQLRRRAPSLVVLEYGTNESGDDDASLTRYESDLRRVVERVRAAVPTASVLVLAPTDRMRRVGRRRHARWVEVPHQPDLVAIQRRVARELGCAFFDTVAWMGGNGAVARWLDAELAIRDHVHLTYRGYALLGNAVAAGLLGEENAPPGRR